MKKFTTAIILSIFSGVAAYGQITNAAPYCAGGYDDQMANIPHYISKVTLGSFTNTSGNTQYMAPHYVYYNNLAAITLQKGSSYNLSVMHDGGQTLHFVAVFIDYNRNNSFADAGEMVMSKFFPGATNPSTLNITVPAGAQAGASRMRVMAFEDDMFTFGHTTAVPCTMDATGSFDWGETEDYAVNITASNTGIPETGADAKPLFYPNPAQNTIQLAEEILGHELTIADVTGKQLVSYSSAPATIDVSSLAAGVYLVRCQGTDGYYLRKLVIAH